MEEQQFNESNVQNKLWPINWRNNKVLKIFGIVSLIGLVLNIVFNLLLYFLYGAGTIFGIPPAGIYPASLEINKFFWESVIPLIFFIMSAVVIVHTILSFLRLKRLDKTDKFFLVINLIIVALVLATDFTGGYQTKSPITESLKEETVNYQTYRNEEYGFTLNIPPEWTHYVVDKEIKPAGSEFYYGSGKTSQYPWIIYTVGIKGRNLGLNYYPEQTYELLTIIVFETSDAKKLDIQSEVENTFSLYKIVPTATKYFGLYRGICQDCYDGEPITELRKRTDKVIETFRVE